MRLSKFSLAPVFVFLTLCAATSTGALAQTTYTSADAPAPAGRPSIIEDVTSTGLRALEGQFNVSGSGSATYSIPLPLPTSARGKTPSTHLVYNSTSGRRWVKDVETLWGPS